MCGVSHNISLISAQPSKEQIALYSVLIRSLRDLPYEHVIFVFQDCDKLENPDGQLAYYQICVHHNNILRTEIGTGPTSNWKLYARESTVTEAIDMFKLLNETRKVPSLEGWRDITDVVKKEDHNNDD